MVKEWKLNIVKILVLPKLFFRFRGTCVETKTLLALPISFTMFIFSVVLVGLRKINVCVYLSFIICVPLSK